MIDMRHKPYFLPQVSVPADVVVSKLNDENIDYDYIQLSPNELNDLNVSQGFVFSDDIYNADINDKKPIWLSVDNTICDGHHRFVKALTDKIPLKAVKINLNFKDTCRLLNRIQDIYEYEEQQRIEEEVSQDVINTDNQANSGVSDSEFLASLEEDNANIQTEIPSKNDKIIIGYRKDPIKENSVIGNFFTINPIDGFDKYEIDFENLLDIDDLGIAYKDSQNPIDILSKIWFPNVNFEKISEKYSMPSINLKNKAIAEKAKIIGYDGIKFNKIIWGLK